MKFTRLAAIALASSLLGSFAHATYSSTLRCDSDGFFDQNFVSVGANPLVSYEPTNLSIASGTGLTTYREPQATVEFDRGIFFVTAQSAQDATTRNSLYALPGTISFTKNSQGLVTHATFDAILRGRDPKRTDTGVSRDFYDSTIDDAWRAGEVRMKCTFRAGE